MKILWLCNIPIPEITIHLGKEPWETGGWMSGLYKLLIDNSDMELCIAFPDVNSGELPIINKLNERVSCFLFLPVNAKMNNHHFVWLLENYKPDVIQIWGTEYTHSCAMMQACSSLSIAEKVAIHVQSNLKSLARHKADGLPLYVVFGTTVKDVLRFNSVYQQCNSLLRRSQYEQKTLALATNVIGRTTWDRAHTYYANSNARYHHCDEALREPFYNSEQHWNPSTCEIFSLFMSQSTDALKGLHVLLKAMPLILRDFPEAKLYTLGPDVFANDWKSRLKRSYYSLYIRKLIQKYDLEKSVVFLGCLNADKIKSRLLASHVAILSSSIENGSMFVAEAKILGVPVVASYVGGVASVIKHGVDGFFYQHNEHEVLAYYVKKIFGDDALAERISAGAMKSAQIRHDRNTIWNTMERIYSELARS